MPGEVIQLENITGLNAKEIPALREQYGKNIFLAENNRILIHILWDIIREPMFLLLIAACALYFILGEITEGFMMLAAMCFVAAISVYQETRSSRALKALQEFNIPKITVLRDQLEKIIDSLDLLPGDVMILEEGNHIPADAILLQANDLSVNESIITGEAFPVEKKVQEGMNMLYQGTTVNSGKCICRVSATGNNTMLGKMGKSLTGYNAHKSLLQKQTGRFVNKLALFGLAAFILIWLVNFLKSDSMLQSLLFGLTLAMAAIPEEIPVAFSSFMALGAYKMSRLGIITRQPQTIENLGAVSVICLDKTGTITENRMELKTIYDHDSQKLSDPSSPAAFNGLKVLYSAMLASESDPFDAMEKAIHEAYRGSVRANEKNLKQVYEYPLEGKPPMMTHVYQDGEMKLIAAKGAAERIMRVCRLEPDTEKKILNYLEEFTNKGFRVLAVASAVQNAGVLPPTQDDFNWHFEGLVCFYDPPKKNIEKVFRQFYDAKIGLKIITGDYPQTAIHIAGQVRMSDYKNYLTGEAVMNMNEVDLKKVVKKINLFARMFPEAKLRVIEALKANGEIVAMTGDGVNDGPALKAADIGIAMGKKGTEIARQAADLILTDDNLEKVSEAILHGRKIFSNLKKAIRYIISIHIPIILTAALPLLLGWRFPNIFTPVHIIFLELIMGPTCSIFFEREPVERDIMQLPPRDRTTGLFKAGELLISIIQGLVIAGGVLMMYYVAMKKEDSLMEVRTLVFTTLVFSNIFLTFVNRSFTENFTKTIFYKNNLAPWLLIISVCFLAGIHLIPFVRNIFQLAPVGAGEIGYCAAVAFAVVMWFELYKVLVKMIKRK